MLTAEHLRRVETLPRLEELLVDRQASEAEHRARMLAAAEATGLKVRKHKPGRYKIIRSTPRERAS